MDTAIMGQTVAWTWNRVTTWLLEPHDPSVPVFVNMPVLWPHAERVLPRVGLVFCKSFKCFFRELSNCLTRCQEQVDVASQDVWRPQRWCLLPMHLWLLLRPPSFKCHSNARHLFSALFFPVLWLVSLLFKVRQTSPYLRGCDFRFEFVRPSLCYQCRSLVWMCR